MEPISEQVVEQDAEPVVESPAAELTPPEVFESPRSEPVPQPAPLAEQVVLPPQPQSVRSEPAAAAHTDEGFLKRMAASGGGPDTDATPSSGSKFLTRVAVRPLGEVEVPTAQPAPPPVTRSVASGIGPENPGDDISAPAYTRKYMD